MLYHVISALDNSGVHGVYKPTNIGVTILHRSKNTAVACTSGEAPEQSQKDGLWDRETPKLGKSAIYI